MMLKIQGLLAGTACTMTVVFEVRIPAAFVLNLVPNLGAWLMRNS